MIIRPIRPLQFRLIVCTGIFIAGMTGLARAAHVIIPTTPPPAQWSGALSGTVPGNSYSNPAIALSGYASFGLDGAAGQIDGVGGLSPSLSASVSAGYSADGTITASAFDSLTYAFEIVGPVPGVESPVDLQVTATGSVATSLQAAPFNSFAPGNSADASFEIYPAGGDFSLVAAVSSGYQTGLVGDSFSTANGIYGSDEGQYNAGVTDGVFTAYTDEVYFVNLTVGASVSTSGGWGSDSSSATIDPIIQIASDVTDPGDYTFEYSTGLETAPAPDEPNSLLILSLALAALVGLRRGYGHVLSRV